jgi:hypothetical protein
MRYEVGVLKDVSPDLGELDITSSPSEAESSTATSSAQTTEPFFSTYSKSRANRGTVDTCMQKWKSED